MAIRDATSDVVAKRKVPGAPLTFAVPGLAYRTDVRVIDNAGDVQTFTLEQAPSGMFFHEGRRELVWQVAVSSVLTDQHGPRGVTVAFPPRAAKMRMGEECSVSERRRCWSGTCIRIAPGTMGKPVRLIACRAGEAWEGIAQQLADELGVAVEANSGVVTLLKDGSYSAGGIWRTFWPR
ncbi:MAG: hypothetical protein HYV07_07365 [Deltaproteobacteria bacterium]|nr:hypothetical protein [Deltaproteobacteria bacterium]